MTLIWESTFDGRFEEKDHAIAVFLDILRKSNSHVPADKLLVYDVKEGWEPLCSFLGKDVPADSPFPHLNNRDNFLGNVRRQQQSNPNASFQPDN